MSFVIKAKTLAEIVGIASKACGGRSTMAIAECARLRFKDEEIAVDTFDFDNWLSVSTPNAESVLKDCPSVIIPCKQFYSIIASLPGDQDVTLSATKKQLTVKSGTSKYNFGLLDEEWPDLPLDKNPNIIEMDSANFVQCLQFVDSSIGADEVRHYLNGVNLRSMGTNSLRFIATSGYCASMTILPLAQNPSMPKKGVILPAKMVNLCIDLLGKIENGGCDIRLELTEALARLQFSAHYKIFLAGRLLDGSFPDIDKVIPYKRDNAIIVVPRQTMIDGLRRIEVFCDVRTRGISLNFDPARIRIVAKSDHSDAEEIIDAVNSGCAGTVTVNIKLLTNLLLSMKNDTVTFLLLQEDVGSAVILVTEGDTTLTPTSSNFSILVPMVPIRV